MSTPQLQLAYDQIHSVHYNKISQLTKPLREFFQAPYFSYQKVYLDGRYTLMANNPDFLEHYLSKRFYAYDPFLVSPYLHHDGKAIFIVSDEFMNFDDQTRQTLEEIEKKYGFCESILILIKNFDYYEIFVFSLSIKGKKGIQFFFSNMDLIERFINYFRTNMRGEIESIYEIGINIAKIREVNFRDEKIIKFNEEQNKRDEFIKLISPEEYELVKNMDKLTAREVECLYWMAKGKTAFETAQILNISKRTVEVFREKCKAKLGPHYTFSNLIYNLGKYKLLDFL